MKVGIVGIVGGANVGKSTILNQILKEKLSIVTPRPQTTRVPILGILNGKDYQIAFMDTPGMMERIRHELHRAMIEHIEKVIRNGDFIVLIVEPQEPGEREEKIINLLNQSEKQANLVINKIDRVEKKFLLPIIDKYAKSYTFKEILPVCAIRGEGIDDLILSILKYIGQGEPLYPRDEISDKHLRFFVEEIIREKVFFLYGQEIPYSSAVKIDTFDENKDPCYIRAIIYVERDSQKGIIIGKKGRAIKKLGIEARKDIEVFLGHRVFLELWVKVQEGWRKDKRFLQELEY